MNRHRVPGLCLSMIIVKRTDGVNHACVHDCLEQRRARPTKTRRVLEGSWSDVRGSGRQLAIYTSLAPMELMGPLEGAVVIEFPDMETAKSWYESPGYRKARQLRDGAADCELFIIDGGIVAAEDRMPHTKVQQS